MMIPEIQKITQAYPKSAQIMMRTLIGWIQESAQELGIAEVEQSLKWGEPSFASPIGSPIRMAYNNKDPQHFSIFFVCTTSLVETFREIYGDQLILVGNRQIKLALNEPLPEETIRHCLRLGLSYKKVKHLPLLGA